MAASHAGGAERWDPNAAGTYLQTCPDFALAITAHSVSAAEEEEAAAEEAAEKGGKSKEAGAYARPHLC